MKTHLCHGPRARANSHALATLETEKLIPDRVLPCPPPLLGLTLAPQHGSAPGPGRSHKLALIAHPHSCSAELCQRVPQPLQDWIFPRFPGISHSEPSTPLPFQGRRPAAHAFHHAPPSRRGALLDRSAGFAVKIMGVFHCMASIKM